MTKKPFRLQRTGAAAWGDDHKTGSARERKYAQRTYSLPEERPPCPRCGADGRNINKAKDTTGKGRETWWCFMCRKRFYATEIPVLVLTECPACGSTNIEQEKDGTIVCWSCPWSS